MPDVQKAIQAMLKALQVPLGAPAVTPPRRVVCISRDYGSGGDEVARLLAKRLGLELYDRVVIDRIAKRLDAEPATMQAVDTGSSHLRDLWLYSLVTGQDLSERSYKRHLINVVVTLGRTGGVILGAAAHLILARSGALRVRFTGSAEACAKRVAAAESLSIEAALKRIEDMNHRRGEFVWEHFQARLNDPRTFDLIINTDRVQDYEKVVDMLVAAADMLGLPPSGEARP